MTEQPADRRTEEKNESPLDRMGPDVPRCGRPTKAGGVCPRACQPGESACWTHLRTPQELAEQTRGRSANRRAVAVGAGLQLTPEEIENIAAIATQLGTATEPIHVRDAIAKTAALVLAGSIPPRVAAAVNQLANTTLRAISDDLSKELAEIRALLAKHASPEVRSWATRRRH